MNMNYRSNCAGC